LSFGSITLRLRHCCRWLDGSHGKCPFLGGGFGQLEKARDRRIPRDKPLSLESALTQKTLAYSEQIITLADMLDPLGYPLSTRPTIMRSWH